MEKKTDKSPVEQMREWLQYQMDNFDITLIEELHMRAVAVEALRMFNKLFPPEVEKV